MTLEEAEKIAKSLIEDKWGWHYKPGDETAYLEGVFTPEQLEAIAIFVRVPFQRAERLADQP